MSVSNVEIRPLTAEDAPARLALSNQAFAQGRVVPAQDVFTGPVVGEWGAFEGGRLGAALSIRAFQCHWGPDAFRSMGGIAGVATFVEARGRGHVDLLLRQSLRAMREAGQTISALYPFAWAFYRKYGWDWVGEKRRTTIKLGVLPSSPEGHDVEEISGNEDISAALTDAYTAFASRYRGTFTTDGGHRWSDHLSHNDGRTTYVFRYRPTGEYFLWRFEAGDRKGEVREWTAVTPEGCRALLSVLHYLATQIDSVRIVTPTDVPLWSHIMHWDIETCVSPVFMGRVVDVGRAVSELPAREPFDSVAIRIRDEYAPWNDGIWRIEPNGESLAAELADSGGREPDLAMDIQAFTQAYWGTPSLETLRAAGRLEVANEAGFARLCRLFGGAPPVYTMDHF